MDDLIPFFDLPDGDDVYLFHPPERGEVIVLNSQEGDNIDLIKRVIGLPGDTIEFDSRGGPIRVNGVEIEETWLSDRQGTRGQDITLGEDEYFVMGDNRPHSNDSRHWEHHFAVHRDHIIGTQLISYDLPIDLGFANSAD